MENKQKIAVEILPAAVPLARLRAGGGLLLQAQAFHADGFTHLGQHQTTPGKPHEE